MWCEISIGNRAFQKAKHGGRGWGSRTVKWFEPGHLLVFTVQVDLCQGWKPTFQVTTAQITGLEILLSRRKCFQVHLTHH